MLSYQIKLPIRQASIHFSLFKGNMHGLNFTFTLMAFVTAMNLAYPAFADSPAHSLMPWKSVHGSGPMFLASFPNHFPGEVFFTLESGADSAAYSYNTQKAKLRRVRPRFQPGQSRKLIFPLAETTHGALFKCSESKWVARDICVLRPGRAVTRLLKGASPDITTMNSNLEIMSHGGVAFFPARLAAENSQGNNLWRSDGSSGNTGRIFKVKGMLHTYPDMFSFVGDRLVFQSWVSLKKDGSPVYDSFSYDINSGQKTNLPKSAAPALWATGGNSVFPDGDSFAAAAIASNAQGKLCIYRSDQTLTQWTAMFCGSADTQIVSEPFYDSNSGLLLFEVLKSGISSTIGAIYAIAPDAAPETTPTEIAELEPYAGSWLGMLNSGMSKMLRLSDGSFIATFVTDTQTHIYRGNGATPTIIHRGSLSLKPVSFVSDEKNQSDETAYAIINDRLIFLSKTGSAYTLWESDGTSDGTSAVSFESGMKLKYLSSPVAVDSERMAFIASARRGKSNVFLLTHGVGRVFE